MHGFGSVVLASLLLGCGRGQPAWVFDSPVWTATWDGGGSDEDHALARQADGKFLVAGSRQNATTDMALVRFNEDGSLDTGFGNGGSIAWDAGGFDSAYGVAVQADGKIVMMGASWNGTDYEFPCRDTTPMARRIPDSQQTESSDGTVDRMTKGAR